MNNRRLALNKLKNCSTFHDFIFVHRGVEYPVNYLLIAAVSPAINSSMIRYELPPIEGPIQDFISLLYGQSVLITPLNCRFFNYLAKNLKIQALADQTYQLIQKTNTLDNVINFAEHLLACDLDASEEIDLIAYNFPKIIENPFLHLISPKLLTEILRSPSFTMSSISLIKFINYMIENEPDKYMQNAQYFIKSGLDTISTFTTLQSSFDLNTSKYLLIPLLQRMQFHQEKSKVYLPKPGKEFDGFFNAVAKQYQSSIALFSITASSENSESTTVTNLLHPEDKNSYFDTKGSTDEWIQVKIGSGTFELSHYVFMSWRDANKGSCPSSWVVLGSVDGNSWVEIDRVENDRSLLAPSAVSLFKVKSICPPLTYFKFVQLDTCSARNKRFVLAGLEIYGKHVE